MKSLYESDLIPKTTNAFKFLAREVTFQIFTIIFAVGMYS